MLRSIMLAFALLVFSLPANAADEAKPEDSVVITLSSEGWVTTQTARVTVAVEAAVNDNTSASTRAEMLKAVENLSKADWKLISFNRRQDQTGMERWSARFEARLPENQLSGLGDLAKKQSKAGMQLSVASIDFTPTLEEMENTYGNIRTQIYKDAVEQLAEINSAIPGRNYRIALINFVDGNDGQAIRPMMQMRAKNMSFAAESDSAGAASSMERSEKIALTAKVIFAATPAKQ